MVMLSIERWTKNKLPHLKNLALIRDIICFASKKGGFTVSLIYGKDEAEDFGFKTQEEMKQF